MKNLFTSLLIISMIPFGMFISGRIDTANPKPVYVEPITESGVVEREVQIESVTHLAPVPEECKLTDDQMSKVKFSIDYAQEYDMSYTLAAIALKESNAGRWKVNIQDPSGGLYHVTLDKVLTYYGWEKTPFNLNRAMQRLVDNDTLAAELAVKELLFWKDLNSGNWLDTWANYNAGTHGKNTTRGKQYAEDIRQLIVKIKQCGWDETNDQA